jgi:hypothetical protein
MIIKADKEATEVITQFCDMALKNAGMSNLKVVSRTLNCMTLIEPEQDAEETESKKQS